MHNRISKHSVIGFEIVISPDGNGEELAPLPMTIGRTELTAFEIDPDEVVVGTIAATLGIVAVYGEKEDTTLRYLGSESLYDPPTDWDAGFDAIRDNRIPKSDDRISKYTVIGFALLSLDGTGEKLSPLPLTIGLGSEYTHITKEESVTCIIPANPGIAAVFGNFEDNSHVYLGCESRDHETTNWDTVFDNWLKEEES